MRAGDTRRFAGVSGEEFTATVVAEHPAGTHAPDAIASVDVVVAGRAYRTGMSTFLREDDDPLREGFLPRWASEPREPRSVLRAAREHPGDDADRADDGEHQRHTAGRSEQLDDAAQQ